MGHSIGVLVAVLAGRFVAVAVLTWVTVKVCVGTGVNSGGWVDVTVDDGYPVGVKAVAVEGTVDVTVDVLDGEAAGVVGVAGAMVAVGLLQSLVYNRENVLRGLLPPLCATPPAIALPGERAVIPNRMLVVVPELALLAMLHSVPSQCSPTAWLGSNPTRLYA
jgi:hypothetical protein